MNKFVEILKPIAELIEKKNTDYGNSFDLLRDKRGPISFYIRIEDKLNRLERLDNNPAQVKDESTDDTLNDIIGYCALEIIYRKEKREKYNKNRTGCGDDPRQDQLQPEKRKCRGEKCDIKTTDDARKCLKMVMESDREFNFRTCLWRM